MSVFKRGPMTALTRKRTMNFFALLATVVAVLFWSQNLRLRATQSEQRTVLASRRLPFLLTGLRVEVPTLVDIVDGTRGTQFAEAPGRRYLVALSDRCPFCKEAEPAICEVLKGGGVRGDDEIVLVSFGGVEILTRLLSCARQSPAVPAVVGGLIRNTQQFSMLTGILATPSFVRIDASWRVIAAYSARQAMEWQADVLQVTHELDSPSSERR